MFTWVQRSMMYFPARVAAVPTAECGLPPGQVHEIEVPVADDVRLSGWLVLAAGQAADDPADGLAQLTDGRTLLLYFPGNAGHRGYRANAIADFTELGIDVVLVDYRGYAEKRWENRPKTLFARRRPGDSDLAGGPRCFCRSTDSCSENHWGAPLRFDWQPTCAVEAHRRPDCCCGPRFRR